MSTKTVADNQSKVLQTKLNAAIASRASLEEDFKSQSSMLIEFINKLSLLSRGMDIKLDNRLAQLRGLLTKSAPISDIELKIIDLTKLIQQQSASNEKNIAKLHSEFTDAGQSLQKTKGLPDGLRRKLRFFLSENSSAKDSIIQYTQPLTQLLEFYVDALKSNSQLQSSNSANNLATDTACNTVNNSENHYEKETGSTLVNAELIEQISNTLGKLRLSSQHTKDLLEIKKKLLKDTTNDEVIKSFIEIFDVIVADLENERNSATNFLKTLNKTLTTVQSAVKETLSTCDEAQQVNDKINIKLQDQLSEMTDSVEKALSLDQVKVDINDKLSNIAQTLETKSKLEQRNQENLSNQLRDMSNKVKNLEKQSQRFEEKLAEQQRKSLQDALTRLSNRAAFDEYFTQSMVRFHHKPFKLSLAVIDIDDFKNINDTYGHTAGDKTLQVIANTIQKKVSKDAFVARYGGEEFVLIYTNQTQESLVKELNLINNSIARLPFKFKNNSVNITLSIGATHITKEDNIHTAFERADEAMYKAKSQGKNQVVYF